jgi:hypothetical protein
VSARSAAEEDQIYTDAFVGERSWNGRERNQLLWNRGGGGFVEAGAAFGLDDLRDARGLAAADFDHDGDVDFVVNNYRAQAACFENQVGAERAWLAVRLRGAGSNTDAVGATVTVVAAGRWHSAVVAAGSGYASQNSAEQVLGLGGAGSVDEVLVRWPGGSVEAFGPFEVRRRVTLRQGEGEPRLARAPAMSPPKAARPVEGWAGGLDRATAGALATLGVFGLAAIALGLLRRPMGGHD